MSTTLRTPRDIGTAIRDRRTRLGLRQAELAEKIGVSRLWVNQVEAGKSGAGIGLVLRAFQILGISIMINLPDDENQQEDHTPVYKVNIDSIVDAARQKRAP